jgi:hypothetical protein
MSQPLRGAGCAEALKLFLQDVGDKPLPRLRDIALKMPIRLSADAWLVSAGLEILARRNVIAMRHGTRTEARGHYAIRVMATGQVLKTDGCPFEPPP